MLVSLLISGCFGQKSAEEKMYEVLENVVAAEKGFENQQDPIVELEKKEKEIYKTIISLGMKEYEQITKLSDEAIEIVAKRKDHMDKEQKSMEASEKEFANIEPIIEKLDDPELQKQAEELSEVMNDRYEIHQKLYDYYLEGLQYDTELYKMFKEKETSIEQLEKKVTLINETYDKVLKANDLFNQLTKKYNETKMSFYKQAGLNVGTNKE
jgi:hypothetical protein